MKTLGQIAHEAFHASMVAHGADDRGGWDKLPIHRQNSWDAAAEAVLAAERIAPNETGHVRPCSCDCAGTGVLMNEHDAQDRYCPCPIGIERHAFETSPVTAPQGAPYECNCQAPYPEAVHNLKRFPEDAPRAPQIDRTPKSDASCRCGSQWCRFCSG